jgi:hypothetical protein
MKIGFFTEASYKGTPPRNHPNMRTDLAWVHSLNATHHPWFELETLESNIYDFGIIIIPKQNKDKLREFPLIEHMRRVCKKIGVMQESTYYYWQDGEVEDQVWYFNTLVDMDVMLCHNEIDKKYYEGILDIRCEYLPTLMVTDFVKEAKEKSDSVMVGGNWVSIYRGFDDYIVAKTISDNINAPVTGRMKPEEVGMDINHLQWVDWLTWMYELSKNKYAVHLGEPGAGTFNLNCSYLGIPCVGLETFNTQKICHPRTTVEVGDIGAAKLIAKRLKDDKGFYNSCSVETKQLYRKYYHEDVFKYKMNKLIGDIVSE